jgi:hypothetical protein
MACYTRDNLGYISDNLGYISDNLGYTTGDLGYTLSRIGYGSQFNDLFIENDIITKKSKTDYGYFKIHKEILFFKYILSNNISLPIPTIYEFGKDYYKMKYLSDYIPLYKYFTNFSDDKKHEILEKIRSELNKLHISTTKLITKEQFNNIILSETCTKIYKRYQEITDILKNYTHIKKVNNIELLSFDKTLDILQNKVSNYIDSLSNNSYNIAIIHGDCQFNNILYNPTNDDFVFIDPRGYFGNLDLYGIPEYDFAKIKFALSGYDIFDNMEIDSLQIVDDNLILPAINIVNNDNLFKKDDIISILTISVWLGNAHCFKNNIPKAIFSFYYALYLASLYL